jgi:hypothetical protein
VKFQLYDIVIQSLTPVDRIPKATCQLKDSITQQPKKEPLDGLRAIELLCKVILEERRKALTKESVQSQRAHQGWAA